MSEINPEISKQIQCQYFFMTGSKRGQLCNKNCRNGYCAKHKPKYLEYKRKYYQDKRHPKPNPKPIPKLEHKPAKPEFTITNLSVDELADLDLDDLPKNDQPIKKPVKKVTKPIEPPEEEEEEDEEEEYDFEKEVIKKFKSKPKQSHHKAAPVKTLLPSLFGK